MKMNVTVTKEKNERRIYKDYKALNKIAIKICYPLPEISDPIDQLKGTKYFTKIDLACGCQ